MTWLRCADAALFKLVSLLAQLFLLAAVLVGFWQVVTRFMLESPADWSEITTRALLIWAVLLGVALAFRHGAMLGVDFLRTLLAAPAQRVLAWAVGVICMGFLGMLAWVGGQMVWRVRFQTLPSLEISISWVYLAIPVGASLAAIAVLARLLDRAAVTELRNDAQG
ncbi:MAG: TRAP transporter small permease [Comamonas sp.]|nr:TRAP transporter small permease [Comamonas sp.]